VAFQSRISTFKGAGKGIKRDFQSPCTRTQSRRGRIPDASLHTMTSRRRIKVSILGTPSLR